MRFHRRTALISIAAAVVASSMSGLALLADVMPASADPKWPSALIGHGDDATEGVIGAMAGEESGQFYLPAATGPSTGQAILNSWDAFGSPCTTPRNTGVQIPRAVGAEGGLEMLSRSIDGASFGGSFCGGFRTPAGLIDFARSSSGPTGSGAAHTYIPFARDALSFAYAVNGVAPVTGLTRAQVNQILTASGGVVINGTHILACGIDTRSGTFRQSILAFGFTAGNEIAGTEQCNSAGNGERLRPNDGVGLKAKSDAMPNTQVIMVFSSANYIAANNGVLPGRLPSPAGTVGLGSITGIGLPYTGSIGGSMAPNPAYYADTMVGHHIYNVVSTTRLQPPATANAPLKAMFVGPGSAVCQTTSIIQAFGYLTIGSECGSTTLTGPLI